jgi:hypothetical protein
MTQKRILRATMRQVARERDLLVRDAFRLYSADVDDPEVAALLSKLAEQDPDDTAQELFAIANWLIDDLAESTGATRDEVLARLHRR